MANAAIAAGADGLLVDVHHQPEQALCDGEQAILPDDLARLVRTTHAIHASLQDNLPIPA
jgi:3-deoxy-7-phosphoheptulonate synthase